MRVQRGSELYRSPAVQLGEVGFVTEGEVDLSMPLAGADFKPSTEEVELDTPVAARGMGHERSPAMTLLGLTSRE